MIKNYSEVKKPCLSTKNLKKGQKTLINQVLFTNTKIVENAS